MRTESIKVPVHSGHVEVEVAGAGTPIILLHGWALDRRIWRPQIEYLSRRFLVVAVDRRGFGRSTAAPDLTREVDDLLAVRRTLGLERMILAGMSQGGRVALHFALAHPERLLGLVLQGAPLDGFKPEPWREDAIPLASYAGLVREGRLDAMKSLWRGHALMRLSSEPARADVERILADYEARDLLAACEVEMRPIAGELESIYAPTLVVTGENDTPWRHLVADAIAYGVPRSRREIVPGGDHLCNVTQAARFNALVEGFAVHVEEVAPTAL